MVPTGPLACQDNDRFPMLPTFHIIGNVTQAADGAITLEPINDCSGVTYYKGLYHVWHQCCQVSPRPYALRLAAAASASLPRLAESPADLGRSDRRRTTGTTPSART